MLGKRAITVVSAHAEGEVGRVITGGVLPPPGETVRAQRDALMADDGLRRFLIHEPRGGVFAHYNLVVPPKSDGADAGFIIMEPADYPPMSGSNSLCVATVLLETGMVAMREPETLLTLDAPGGVVRVRCTCRDGRVRRAETMNVPCYVEAMDQPLDVPGLGVISVDLAFGGDFVLLTEAAPLGLTIEPAQARALVDVGERIKRAAREAFDFRHAGDPSLGGISFVTLTEPVSRDAAGVYGRSATVISPGKIDRSPTGTASSARLACLYARGTVQAGEPFVSRSILDTAFTLGIAGEAQVGERAAIIPTIAGRAWITGLHTYLLDPDDPFPQGYRLADTWGASDA